MTERTITVPCGPGDTLWLIVGDKVRECTVKRMLVSADETGCAVRLDVLFIAPNPFVEGQMREYREFAILGRRERAYRAAYPTEEEAKAALAKEGPDYT